MVKPLVPPAWDRTITAPPAPPPPPPSLAVVLYAAAPLAVIVSVPVRNPARTMPMPPPAAPELACAPPGESFRPPAPPPPPMTTRLIELGNAAPETPPEGRAGQFRGGRRWHCHDPRGISDRNSNDH